MYSKDKGWPTANCITGHVANTTGNGGVTCKQILNIRYLITEDNIISFTITNKKKKFGGYGVFLCFITQTT
jgi:hypothetical protein